MRPVVSTVRVDRPRAEVFAVLDVLGNHEAFTDHFMRDWTTSGPASGVGARARMRVVLPGRPTWLDMVVVSVRPPEEIVEESRDDTGTRHNRGTFRLYDEADGSTRVEFALEQLAAPWPDRLAAPLARSWLRRGNDRSLARLAEQLAAAPRSH